MDVRASAKILQGRRWTEIGFGCVKRKDHDAPESQRGDPFHGTNDEEHGHVIQRARHELKEKRRVPGQVIDSSPPVNNRASRRSS